MENMKNHQITVEGLTEWKNQTKIVYASSTKEKKTLFVTLNGSFEIEVNDELVFQGMQPFAAVEKYNSI